jgi:Tfp pilus assembly protein PilO
MKLLSTKDEDRTTFYKILMVLGVLLFFFFIKNIFIDQVRDVIDEFDRYANMSERLESLSNWKEKKISLHRQINKLQKQLGESNTFLKGEGESSLGLSVIDSIAKLSSVEIEEIKMNKTGLEKPFKRFNAQIKVTGLYFQINDFVRQIEKQAILINVKQFTVNTSSLYARKIKASLNVELLFKM